MAVIGRVTGILVKYCIYSCFVMSYAVKSSEIETESIQELKHHSNPYNIITEKGTCYRNCRKSKGNKLGYWYA